MASPGSKFLSIKVESKSSLFRLSSTSAVGSDLKVRSEKLLTDQTKFIALKIKEHIEDNLIQGKRFDTGGNVAPLSPVTVKHKGFKRPFLETGKLFKSIRIRKSGKGYEVYVLPQRAEIAARLQIGGASTIKGHGTRKLKGFGRAETSLKGGIQKKLKGGAKIILPPRPFFGINKKNFSAILKDAKIEEKIRQLFK